MRPAFSDWERRVFATSFAFLPDMMRWVKETIEAQGEEGVWSRCFGRGREEQKKKKRGGREIKSGKRGWKEREGREKKTLFRSVTHRPPAQMMGMEKESARSARVRSGACAG